MTINQRGQQVLAGAATRNPRWNQGLKVVDGFLMAAGAAAVVVEQGSSGAHTMFSGEAGLLASAVMLAVSFNMLLCGYWSLQRSAFLYENQLPIAFSAIWLIGLPIVAFRCQGMLGSGLYAGSLGGALAWSELVLIFRSLLGFLRLLRAIETSTSNPVLVFAASFLIVIMIGTALLSLPVSRAPVAAADGSGTVTKDGAPFLVALFTSTSAACVTGLTVVDTGTYWSPIGMLVIACLIQVGGLGIMMFGAFFSLIAARSFELRENVFLGSLLESQNLQIVRRLVMSIFAFTIGAELVGAVLLSTLWPELPFPERMAYGAFHSVSAFCNAGFALRSNQFEGWGNRWQIYAVVPTLVIVGGLGFAVLQDVSGYITARIERAMQPRWSRNRKTPPRLTLSSKIVLVTTFALLAGGMLSFFLVERNELLKAMPVEQQLTEAWFQSVTCRTAGYNTLPQSQLHPASKLIAIVLMFIGASPISTGGGVKTTIAAIGFIAGWSILRGNERVEVAGRTLADALVKRAATIFALGLNVVLISTFMVVLIENRGSQFLDHLFEVTSAFGTVGLSAVTTDRLKPASQLVLIVTMFIGRVGPLTLLLALAGRVSPPSVEYPLERVCLG